MPVTEVSLGDYVLFGGEVAVLVILEAVIRLLPGVLGNADSLVEESHADGLLEAPVYTKPPTWRGLRGTRGAALRRPRPDRPVAAGAGAAAYRGPPARPAGRASTRPRSTSRTSRRSPGADFRYPSAVWQSSEVAACPPARVAARISSTVAGSESPTRTPATGVPRVHKDAAMNTLDALDAQSRRTDIPDFRAGDTLKVHARVVEGNRSRIQIFQGVVIRRQGAGLRETFTVRKVSFGVGVERTYPINSPVLDRIEVVTRGDVRRAKLYYLRDLRGKKAKIKEKRDKVPADRPRRRRTAVGAGRLRAVTRDH